MKAGVSGWEQGDLGAPDAAPTLPGLPCPDLSPSGEPLKCWGWGLTGAGLGARGAAVAVRAARLPPPHADDKTLRRSLHSQQRGRHPSPTRTGSMGSGAAQALQERGGGAAPTPGPQEIPAGPPADPPMSLLLEQSWAWVPSAPGELTAASPVRGPGFESQLLHSHAAPCARAPGGQQRRLRSPSPRGAVRTPARCRCALGLEPDLPGPRAPPRPLLRPRGQAPSSGLPLPTSTAALRPCSSRCGSRGCAYFTDEKSGCRGGV